MQPELIKKIIHRHRVTQDDLAHFKYEKVHYVCSTFTLAREIEWTTRQFIKKIKKDDQEGIGTMLEILHHNPAFMDDEFIVTAEVDSYEHDELICSFEVKVGERIIASGRTGQKLLPKTVLDKKFKNQ